MSTVHSVSDITNILSTIIQSQPTLQDVWVQGEISQKTSSQGYPHCFFMIKNTKNEIECVIHKEYTHIFGVVPAVGSDVLVNGSVVLLPSKGEYRFAITGIEKPGIVSEDKIISVGSLMNTLRTTVEVHSGEVQGKISNKPTKRSGYIHLRLKNANANEDTARETIECQLPPYIANNLSFSLKKGDVVRIDGQFDIFSPVSRYQITAKNIQYAPHTDSPEDEDKVVTVVESYFSQFQGFSTARECEIQMGVDHRSADVVLIDGESIFAAIAECKRNGIVGYGPAQLKSYLCATDTRFGVFANSTNPNSWVFYENLRHNRFQQIDCFEFEKGVVEGIATRDRLSDEIKILESQLKQLRGEIDALKSKKARTATEVRQENQKLDALKQVIEFDRSRNNDLKSSQKHLSEEINQLKTNKGELKTEIEKLEQKERELHTSREQWKEKIQQLETFLVDLKSDLLDSETLSHSEENVDLQKTRRHRKQNIISKLKNRFSKEKQ